MALGALSQQHHISEAAVLRHFEKHAENKQSANKLVPWAMAKGIFYFEYKYLFGFSFLIFIIQGVVEACKELNIQGKRDLILFFLITMILIKRETEFNLHSDGFLDDKSLDVFQSLSYKPQGIDIKEFTLQNILGQFIIVIIR